MYKPVKTVLEQLPLLQGRKDIRVLDLGSGVGRNSIPIAEEIKNNGKVICVDFLSSAIEKLREYSKEYGVNHAIEFVKSDIADYEINENAFDYIVAVSSLEHVATEPILDQVLNRMALGTKKVGINSIIINSEVEEIDLDTNENIDELMEINLSTEAMINKLNQIYNGWEILNQLVKPLEYKIERNGKHILLKTNAITFVVRKK